MLCRSSAPFVPEGMMPKAACPMSAHLFLTGRGHESVDWIFAFISPDAEPIITAMDPSSLNPIQDNDREAPYVEQNLELMLVYRTANLSNHSTRLRQELNARNIHWAEKSGFPHERSIGADSTVLYLPDGRGRHGNFHTASYKRILTNPEWRKRLVKTHTTAHRILVSHDRDRRELDSCNSSDALLMNIFCHPRSSERGPLSSFLSFETNADSHLRLQAANLHDRRPGRLYGD